MKTSCSIYLLAGLLAFAPLPSLEAASTPSDTITAAKKTPQTIFNYGSYAPRSFPSEAMPLPHQYSSSGLAVTLTVKSGPGILINNEPRPIPFIYHLQTTGAGMITLEATQEGNRTFAPARPVTIRILVKTSQTITFVQPQDVRLTSLAQFAPYSFTPEVSATSGLPVKVTVISGPAIMVGKKVKVESPGTIVLRAEQVGNSIYAPAVPVERTFSVKIARQGAGGG